MFSIGKVGWKYNGIGIVARLWCFQAVSEMWTVCGFVIHGDCVTMVVPEAIRQP